MSLVCNIILGNMGRDTADRRENKILVESQTRDSPPVFQGLTVYDRLSPGSQPLGSPPPRSCLLRDKKVQPSSQMHDLEDHELIFVQLQIIIHRAVAQSKITNPSLRLPCPTCQTRTSVIFFVWKEAVKNRVVVGLASQTYCHKLVELPICG